MIPYLVLVRILMNEVNMRKIFSTKTFFVLLLSLIGIFLAPQSLLAKNFRNAYVSFDLPDNWQCHLEDTEWICRSQDKKEARQAIIILTAKEVGPADSLKSYENHLKTPKVTANRSGQPITSKVKHTKKNQVNNHIWIDGLHLSSEVSGYYTRYLATTKGKIAILVTFSAHQRFYTNYTHHFFKAIQSLKVVATNALFAKPNMAPIHGANEQFGAGIVEAFPEDMYQEDEYEEDESMQDSGNTNAIAIGLVLLALAGYAYLQISKKQKKNKRKK